MGTNKAVINSFIEIEFTCFIYSNIFNDVQLQFLGHFHHLWRKTIPSDSSFFKPLQPWETSQQDVSLQARPTGTPYTSRNDLCLLMVLPLHLPRAGITGLCHQVWPSLEILTLNSQVLVKPNNLTGSWDPRGGGWLSMTPTVHLCMPPGLAYNVLLASLGYCNRLTDRLTPHCSVV